MSSGVVVNFCCTLNEFSPNLSSCTGSSLLLDHGKHFCLLFFTLSPHKMCQKLPNRQTRNIHSFCTLILTGGSSLHHIDRRSVGAVKRNLSASELRHGTRTRRRHRRASVAGVVPPPGQLVDPRGDDVQSVDWAEGVRRRAGGGGQRGRITALLRRSRVRPVCRPRRRPVQRPAAGPDCAWSGRLEADARWRRLLESWFCCSLRLV